MPDLRPASRRRVPRSRLALGALGAEIHGPLMVLVVSTCIAVVHGRGARRTTHSPLPTQRPLVAAVTTTKGSHR